jgi:hypothetical protein
MKLTTKAKRKQRRMHLPKQRIRRKRRPKRVLRKQVHDITFAIGLRNSKHSRAS